MKHRDPVTGDVLTGGEYVSWVIQGIIRRWTFLVVVLIVTAICWATNNNTVLLWWNLGASLLAIVIESIVGISMFSQTKRDAVILRRVEKQEEYILQLLEKLEKQEDLLLSLLDMHKDGANAPT